MSATLLFIHPYYCFPDYFEMITVVFGNSFYVKYDCILGGSTKTVRMCTTGINHCLIILSSALSLHLEFLPTIMLQMIVVLGLCIVRLLLVKMITVFAVRIKS